MTTPFLGLRTTIYKVNDLASAKVWYSKAFQTTPYFDEPFYVGFNVAGYELGLMPDERAAVDKYANVMNYWGVQDIEKEIERLTALGARPVSGPTNVGGDILVAELKDPWGNPLCLIYNPDFKLP